MILQEALARVVRKENLTREESAEVMSQLMSGEASHAQVAAFLVALHMKGESVEEITGLAETMRRFATRVTTHRHPLVDTCGTGGDHSGTFNISTTAAFVATGAGVAIAKHGNRSASSQCGSADVLEALGVNIDASPEQVGRCIDEVGIGFLFARTLHTAMKHVAPVRSEIKVRTIFNILGPLTNPANADGQVLGIFDAGLVEAVARVLLQLGTRHAFVVAGSDGLDEITLNGSTLVAEVKEGGVQVYEVTPQIFGLAPATKAELAGGDAQCNAGILLSVLKGEKSPHRDIVLLNAAPAIVAGEKAGNFKEGIALAAAAIDSGAAMDKLEQLKKVSHDS